MRIAYLEKIVLGLTLATVLTDGGCSKKIWISQIPPFYDSSLKTIAVTPFRNQTNYRGAGNIMSDRLAAMLRANGTYAIYNRNDHGVLSDERDLQLDLGRDPEKVEALFAKLANVQAILTGVVSTCSATTHNQRKQEPIKMYNQYTKSWYVAGYKSYVWTRNEANVVATAALLRRDGSTIYASPTPAQSQTWAEGSPPKHDPNSLLAGATNAAAAKLLQQFAIVRKQVKIDPSKALRIASEYFEGKWDCTDRISKDTREATVVLELPRNCDRNRFDLRIVRKDQREYLATHTLTWDGSKKWHTWTFDPSKLADDGGGPGTYTIKFFAGQEPAFTKDFQVY